MKAGEIAKRMAASVGGINHKTLNTGQFTPDEHQRFQRAWQDVKKLPVSIEDER